VLEFSMARTGSVFARDGYLHQSPPYYLELSPIDAGADAADIDQPAVVAVIGEQQRTEIWLPAFGFGPAHHHDLLYLNKKEGRDLQTFALLVVIVHRYHAGDSEDDFGEIAVDNGKPLIKWWWAQEHPMEIHVGGLSQPMLGTSD
jgi:hypothetical protein